MDWQDIVNIALFGAVWYLLVAKVLPKIGVGT
jgi:hypothetical protein